MTDSVRLAWRRSQTTATGACVDGVAVPDDPRMVARTALVIVHRLSRSGAFSARAIALLTQLRTTSALTSDAMTYGCAKDWLQKNAEELRDAEVRLEVRSPGGEWQPTSAALRALP